MKKISANLTITTKEFLEKYLGIDYTLEKRLTHKGMNMFLEEKGITPPQSINIDTIELLDVVIGRYLLVRAETKYKNKKKSQIIVYKNPLHEEPRHILEETKTEHELEEIRRKILKEQGLEYSFWGRVEEIIENPTEAYEDYSVTAKTGRVYTYSTSFHKGRKKCK